MQYATQRSRPHPPSLARETASTSTPPELALDNQLCFALYSASLTMTKLYKTVLAPLGLTYPQYLTLLALWEQDGQGVGELGEHLYLDSGTLTPLLKRMEAGGWLVRQRSTDDERRVLVHLTAKGQALRSKARMVPHALAGRTGLDLAQISHLTQRLQRLRGQLQGIPALPRLPEASTRTGS